MRAALLAFFLVQILRMGASESRISNRQRGSFLILPLFREDYVNTPHFVAMHYQIVLQTLIFMVKDVFFYAMGSRSGSANPTADG